MNRPPKQIAIQGSRLGSRCRMMLSLYGSDERLSPLTLASPKDVETDRFICKKIKTSGRRFFSYKNDDTCMVTDDVA